LATGTIILTSNPTNGDTITLNGTTITFITAGIAGQPNQLVLGATVTDTATALQKYLAASTDHNLIQATYDVTNARITVTARSITTNGSNFILSARSGAIQIPTPTLIIPATAPAQFGRVKDWWTGTRTYLQQRVQQALSLPLDAQHMSQWLTDSVA